MMKIEVLYFEGCPNHQPVVAKLKSIIAQHGIDATVEEIEVAAEDVEKHRFLGSPTVQVDGIDIEPAARSRTNYAMSCRVYDAADGLPSERMILNALATESGSSSRAGRIAIGGSLMTALLSSACCWVPLLLLAFGASVAGASAFFERWRPWFIGLAVLSLCAGFYFVYLRKRPASCCDADGRYDAKRSVPVGSQVMLWISTVMVIGFITFPMWGHVLIDDGQKTAISASQIEQSETIVIGVEGMTCPTCEAHLVRELRNLPGVLDASADHDSASARVVATKDNTPGREALVEAVRKAGYSMQEIQSQP